MSNVLSSLQVVLGADTAAFQNDLGRASQSANDNFGSIGAAAKTMAVALAAAFTVDYFTDNIKKAIDYADSMSDLAGKTGIAVEQLTAMEYALNFSDATLENYTDGLQKLTVNMVSSVEGNKDLTDTFKKLGVSVVDAQGNVRQSKDVFLDAAEAISKMQDGAVKTDLAMKLFGKSAGPELIPFLNQGKEGIKELTDEAQRMGAVISTDMANQSAQFNDNMAKMGYAAKGAWNVLAGELLPTLNAVTEGMKKSTTDAGILKSSLSGLGVVFHGLYQVVATSVISIDFFANGLGKVAAIASAFITDGAAAAKAIWNDNTGKEQAKASLQVLIDSWNQVGDAAATANDKQKDAAGGAAATANDKQKDAAGGAAATANDKQKDAAGGAGGGKVLGGSTTKVKTAKEAKDNFEYGGLKNAATELNNIDTAENLSNQGYLANQLIVDEAASQELYALYDEQNAAEIANNALKLDMQRDFVASFLTMDRARVDGSITNGDAALEAHKKQQQMTVTFFQNGLDSMAQGHGRAAKAAQAIQKAQSLYEIGVNTYRAAMGAYAALAPIPIVGPALGIAAAAAAIAFGGSMAQGVMKGGGAPSTPSVSGSTPSSSVLTGSNEIVPISQQQNQTTYIRIPEDRMMTGRQLIDFIDEALGDGKQFNNFRFIPA